MESLETFYLKVLHNVVTRGNQNGGTQELFAIHDQIDIRLAWPDKNFQDIKVRDVDMRYQNAFANWFISGRDDLSELIKLKPEVKMFHNPDTGLYPSRIARQLDDILSEFTYNNLTRRAYISLLNQNDEISRINKRQQLDTYEYNCATGVTFQAREGYLYTHVHMRSNDVFRVINYDLTNFAHLAHHVGSRLRLTPMSMFYTIDNAHIYLQDMDKAKEVLEANKFYTKVKNAADVSTQ